MSTVFLASSPAQTQKIGERQAKNILKSGPRKKAAVLGLVGDLGGGKTTFLQGFAKGMGIKEKILSPTFIIIRRIKNFYHIDCYRIKKTREILYLDFKKIISDPENIVAVEWADRIKKVMPKQTIWIHFKFINPKTRRITIKQQRTDSRCLYVLPD